MLTTLKKSQDPLYVSMRGKTDLFRTIEDCLQAMVENTHAFVESIPYAILVIESVLKVRTNVIECLVLW